MYHPYTGFLSSSGIFEFETILFPRNNILQLHLYLFEFEYHDMRMNNIQINENICNDKKLDGTNILTNDYNEGCFRIIDASLPIESSTFRYTSS